MKTLAVVAVGIFFALGIGVGKSISVWQLNDRTEIIQDSLTISCEGKVHYLEMQIAIRDSVNERNTLWFKELGIKNYSDVLHVRDYMRRTSN